MSLYKPTDQSEQPLNLVYAEDVGQLVDVLTGQRDAGALSLLAPLAAPSAPSTALSSGAITGTGYQWAVYWITGILDGTNTPHITGRTPYGTLTSTQSLSSQQATISISGLTPPTGAIGWGVARNKSPGGTTSGFYTVPGSEQFLSIAGTMPASFVDNVPDGSLVTAAPSVNSTGTSIATILAFGKNTSSVTTTGTSFSTGADLLASALTFIANGTSFYVVKAYGASLSNSTTGAVAQVNLNLDGTDGGMMATTGSEPTGGGGWPLTGQAIIQPSTGAHTVNARLIASAHTATVIAGSGGVSGTSPILLTVERVS